MADLTTIDKQILEGLFQMGGGFVLDFSDRTMGDFFKDDIGININAEKYNYASGSKANRMRGFWAEEDNAIVGGSILKLIGYIESKIILGDFKQTTFSDIKLKAGQKIGNRLLDKKNKESKIETEVDLSEEIGKYLKKSEDEIDRKDYDGAIGTLWTFLEEFFEDLHIRLTGKSIGKNADIKQDYAKIKKLLNLAPDLYIDDKIKQMLAGFSQIIDAIDGLCNTLGDRHKKLKDEDMNTKMRPLKHHALLMLNSAKTLTLFLYDSYKYQTERKEYLEKELLNILESDSNKGELIKADKARNKLSNRSFENIQKNKFVKKRLTQSDGFIKQYIIKKYIEQYNIDSRDKNSKFFGLMAVLYDNLTTEDVVKIYNKYAISKNDQAIYLGAFIKYLVENKISIVPKDIQKEVSVLNSTKYFTFISLFEVLIHQFSRKYNNEYLSEEAKELKKAVKGKEKELVGIIKKYFNNTDYTKQIIDFINQEDVNNFPLPDSIYTINDIINIKQNFPGEIDVNIGGKNIKLSSKGVEKIQKLYGN